MTYAVDFGREFIKLTAQEGVRMTTDQTKDLLNLITLGDDKVDQVLPAFENSFIYQVIVQRKNVFMPNTPVSTKALLWCYSLAAGNPGNAVMLVAVLAAIAAITGEEVTVSDMVDVFPMAVPSEEVFHAMWDFQKGHSHGQKVDNLLDVTESWLTKQEAGIE